MVSVPKLLTQGKKSSMSWTGKMIKGTEDAEAGWRLRINEESSLPIISHYKDHHLCDLVFLIKVD
jgi:hypothetical protein